VVKFSRDGKHLLDWGKKGTGPGEFNLPHQVQLDSKGRVYVSDRENNRIQVFDANGKFLKQWTHLGATQGIRITPRDEMWIITHRTNIENLTYDTLAGRIMKLDIEPAASWARWRARAIGSTSAPKARFHRPALPKRLPLVSGLARPRAVRSRQGPRRGGLRPKDQ